MATRTQRTGESGSDRFASEPERTDAAGDLAGAVPGDVDHRERGQDPLMARPTAVAPTPAAELQRLRRRIEHVRQTVLDLKGARDHCADCFSRGAKAALQALEE